MATKFTINEITGYLIKDRNTVEQLKSINRNKYETSFIYPHDMKFGIVTTKYKCICSENFDYNEHDSILIKKIQKKLQHIINQEYLAKQQNV